MKQKFIEIFDEINNCTACELHINRNNVIVGDGINGAPIMLIGEAPGKEEDAVGKPFIGRSGKLLMQMLSDIGISREKNLYITNTIKCRPPENRNPKSTEIKACASFLEKQIQLHNPKIIILVGSFACQYFLGKSIQISKIHGTFIEHDEKLLFPVYHPAALLRNPKLKPLATADFNKLMEKMHE